MAQLGYREGDWFAVPLPGGGYASGLIARANPDGVLLGYFFGPRRGTVPSLEQVASLSASEAVWVTRFGQLGLLGRSKSNAQWTLLGSSPDWSRTDWPMPVFGRRQELTNRALSVRYADDDPNSIPEVVSVDEVSFEELPEDGLAGAGFVETRLDGLL